VVTWDVLGKYKEKSSSAIISLSFQYLIYNSKAVAWWEYFESPDKKYEAMEKMSSTSTTGNDVGCKWNYDGGDSSEVA
jgi:hypothetical protein